MKKALHAYLRAVMRCALFGLVVWSLFGALMYWPVNIILMTAFGFVISAALVFSPYLLFPAAGYRVRRLLYFAPVLIFWSLRAYNFYMLYTGRYVEMAFSAHSTIFRAWHTKVAECFIVLGVCISIYRSYKTFYDSDPVEELLKGQP